MIGYITDTRVSRHGNAVTAVAVTKLLASPREQLSASTHSFVEENNTVGNRPQE